MLRGEPDHVARMVRAGLLAARPVAPGISGWRERGLAVVDALVRAYIEELARFADATVIEHPFLADAGDYRHVFGTYDNVLSTRVGRTSPAGEDVVLRPDNMLDSVRRLRNSPPDKALVAVGGLMRTLSGSATPLFRDRYIWPALQTTQLVGPAEAGDVVSRHQRALERLFERLGVPVVSVRVPSPGGYGSTCLLTVTSLPSGRPTVLSTTYLMSAAYRARLGAALEVVDVGFTGKVVAVAAMHHADAGGLRLGSILSPEHCWVAASPDRPDPGPLVERLVAAGLRVAVRGTGRGVGARVRLRRRQLSAGVPLLLGLETADRARVLVRPGRGEARTVPLEGVGRVAADEVAGLDEQLRHRAGSRLRAGIGRVGDPEGSLWGCCEDCSASAGAFGVLDPLVAADCVLCGRPGTVRLVAPAGRFY